MPDPSTHQAILLTAPGTAAIAVVRLNGTGVVPFLARHFTRTLPMLKPVHGEIRDGARVIDDPVVTLLSDTRADVCLHGGAWVIHAFLKLAEQFGFTIIDPADGPLPAVAVDGETEIDREVAAFLPMARTELALKVLLAQSAAWERLEKSGRPPSPQRGEGGGEGRNVPQSAGLDHANTAGERATEVERRSANHASPLTQPVPSGERGRNSGVPTVYVPPDVRDRILADRSLYWLLHPPRVAIVGTANVGKSTLANQLFARERVITADLPGTTRDWVGEIADVNGLAVMLVDTPGVRETADPLEHHAISLSRSVIDQADLVILVLDPTQPMEPEQSALLARFPNALKVINKSDRGSFLIADAIETIAAKGQGIDELRHRIVAHFGCDELDVTEARIWTERQRRELAADQRR